MPRNEDELTPKELKFVAEFPIDMNGTQAAIRAGYSEKTARVIAQELLERPRVQNALKDAIGADLAKIGVTRQAVLEEVRRVAFADPRRLIEWDDKGVRVKPSSEIADEDAAVLSEIAIDEEIIIGDDEDEPPVRKRKIKVKTHSKMDALDKLMKHLGLLEKDKGAADTERLVFQVVWPKGTTAPPARIQRLMGGKG